MSNVKVEVFDRLRKDSTTETFDNFKSPVALIEGLGSILREHREKLEPRMNTDAHG
jgi:hypothetical protein